MPNKPYVKPGESEQQEAEKLPGIGLWLVEGLVGLPRLLRIAVTMLLTLAVTLATFPILTLFFRGVAWLTGNPEIVLAYLFTQDMTTLYALLGISVVIGSVFYVIGYRILVGTRGETPPTKIRVLWFFLIGVVAVLISSLWLVRGILVGASTV